MYNLRNRPTGPISLGRGIIRSPTTLASVGMPMSSAAQFSQSAGEPSTSFANSINSLLSSPGSYNDTHNIGDSNRLVHKGTLEGGEENKEKFQDSEIVNLPSMRRRDASIPVFDSQPIPMQSYSDTALLNTTTSNTSKTESRDHEINSMRDELRRCHELIETLQKQQPSTVPNKINPQNNNSRVSSHRMNETSQQDAQQQFTMRDSQYTRVSAGTSTQNGNPGTQFSTENVQQQSSQFVGSHTMQPVPQHQDIQFASPSISHPLVSQQQRTPFYQPLPQEGAQFYSSNVSVQPGTGTFGNFNYLQPGAHQSGTQ